MSSPRTPIYHPRYVGWLARRGLEVPHIADPVRGTLSDFEGIRHQGE